MATLVDLAKKMETLNKRVQATASQAATEAAIDVLTYLSQNTPVDTTKAVSNWQVRLGRPLINGGIIEPYYFRAPEASRKTMVEVGEFILSLKKPGQTIYISNVVPYIGLLNRGRSKQCPQGQFVEAAVYYAEARLKSKQVTLWKE